MFKPIETRYKGYRFRSRLEARWAVFFDSLGIAWEYEKEGFDLAGHWYLPDFWLPQVQMWAEVKGESLTGYESALCYKLADDTGHEVLILVGPPEYRAYPFIIGSFEDDGHTECDCYLTRDYLDERRFYSCVGVDETEQRQQLENDDTYVKAVNVARSARFEHGESGA